MTNKKKRENHNGSQKGKSYSEAVTGNNVIAKEELEKAIHPTRTKMSDG
ncbi:hypothetical protein LC040_06560 [Bacillus tianshenii]|nr:hypothetical protein LC040_06560 [Bacillus tianshenii]